MPGDGSCLFHSLSLALLGPAHEHHEDSTELRRLSAELRGAAVARLGGGGKLFLQGSDSISPGALLAAAAAQYNITAAAYLEQMREGGVWGGGPEIVALANHLRRPIHV